MAPGPGRPTRITDLTTARQHHCWQCQGPGRASFPGPLFQAVVSGTLLGCQLAAEPQGLVPRVAEPTPCPLRPASRPVQGKHPVRLPFHRGRCQHCPLSFCGYFSREIHLLHHHSRRSRPYLAAGQAATSCFLGRPRGRLRGTISPRRKSSPPHTPQGSLRSIAPARHARRAEQPRHRSLAHSTSSGDSAKNRSGSSVHGGMRPCDATAMGTGTSR